MIYICNNMIDKVRFDYDKDKESINLNRVSEFVHDIQVDLAPLAEEINNQNGILVIMIFNNDRMVYSLENLSEETTNKVKKITEPPIP